MGSDFMDEIDCGSFFDQMDDLIEFPADPECGLGADRCNDFPSIWSNPSDALPGSDPLFSVHPGGCESDLSAQISVPYEDIVQLEWLSNFMEDSFSGGGMTLNKENLSLDKDSSHSQYRTSSPVSVLESSSSSTSSSGSSCSGGKTAPLSAAHCGPQRARSKRPRPTTFNPRKPIQLISPTSSITENPHSIPAVESDNIVESHPIKKMQKTGAMEHKKKKKVKLSPSLCPAGTNQNPPLQAVRKCMHCEITKTPQWRAGPMGPKTLCNACGVRYKSGRLFPEYRPAASPTFVPSIHSNSHKKVLEMRSNVASRVPVVMNVTVDSTMMAAEPELIPNQNPSMEYI